jgi:hypothetical protein
VHFHRRNTHSGLQNQSTIRKTHHPPLIAHRRITSPNPQKRRGNFDAQGRPHCDLSSTPAQQWCALPSLSRFKSGLFLCSRPILPPIRNPRCTCRGTWGPYSCQRTVRVVHFNEQSWLCGIEPRDERWTSFRHRQAISIFNSTSPLSLLRTCVCGKCVLV